MSKPEDKIKNSTRRHRDDSAVNRQVNIAKSHGMPVKEPHKLAKHHALDCGVPNCPVCDVHHSPKRERTIQELKFIDTEKY